MPGRKRREKTEIDYRGWSIRNFDKKGSKRNEKRKGNGKEKI